MDLTRSGSSSKGSIVALNSSSDGRNQQLSTGTPQRSIQPESARRQYTVAWICPLRIELTAAMAMLDEFHQPLNQMSGDNNHYTLGSVAGHNIVIACLGSDHGLRAAGHVSQDLKRAFPAVKFWLIVGIAGGVPSQEHDLHLGDVVVGTRVIPYDPKKEYQDSVLRTADSVRPPDQLSKVVNTLASQHDLMQSNHIQPTLESRTRIPPSHYHPGIPDKLFHSKSIHFSQQDRMLQSYVPGPPKDTCDGCDSSQILVRAPRSSSDKTPMIHYGDIASGDTLVRSSDVREKLGNEELKVACFEMESAGLHRELPCLAIRGISDYADSHKDDRWQGYAASTAAAYTRQLLTLLPLDSEQSKQERDQPPSQREETQMARKEHLLKSLKFQHMDSRRANIEREHKNTCQWLLSQAEYLDWLDSSQAAVNRHRGLLWLRGYPGAGKSTLTRFAFEAHRRRARSRSQTSDPELLVSFFFNARGSELERSVLGMYRWLLVQMFEGYTDLQDLLLDPDMIYPAFQGDWNLTILKELFKSAVSSLGERRLVCYVDALDECKAEEIYDIMEPIEDIVRENNRGSFRLFCSSRHYSSLNPRSGIVLPLDHLPGHTDDIKTYIHDRLTTNSDSALEALLLRKANGIFLWVVLAIRILNENERDGVFSSIKDIVNNLPGDLNQMFTRIFESNNTPFRTGDASTGHPKPNLDEFVVAATWILYKKRSPSWPLPVFNASMWAFPWVIESGLAVKYGRKDISQRTALSKPSPARIEKQITSATRGLAEVKDGRVQFIHETVRTFLQSGRLDQTLPGSCFGSAALCHDRLKQSYLWFITCPAVQQWFDRICAEEIEPDPEDWFKEAAAKNTLHSFTGHALDFLWHAEQAALEVPQLEFLNNFPEPAWQKLLATRDGASFDPPSRSLLHYICQWGFVKLLTCGAFGRSRSSAASINSRDEEGQTPLHVAVVYDQSAVVQILIDSGANLDASSRSGKTPLMCSLKSGDYKGRLALYLISRGANIHCRDDFGRHACHLAAEARVLPVIRKLIDKGADLDVRDSNGDTPLMHVLHAVPRSAEGILEREAAIRRECIAVLLAGGADPNLPGRRGRTPLMFAAIEGHTDICKRLLEAGAAVDGSDPSGRTPLLYAALWGSADTLQVLIDHGADVNAVNKLGYTVLHYARENETNTRILIEAGAVEASPATRRRTRKRRR